MAIPTKGGDLRDRANNFDTLITTTPAQNGQATTDATTIHTYLDNFRHPADGRGRPGHAD